MKLPPHRAFRLMLPVLAWLGLCAPVLAPAQELALPQGEHQQAQLDTVHPARGMTMAKVESLFGAPVKRLPAVGQPPISRWEYQGFVVYFEHDKVVHAVIKS